MEPDQPIPAFRPSNQTTTPEPEKARPPTAPPSLSPPLSPSSSPPSSSPPSPTSSLPRSGERRPNIGSTTLLLSKRERAKRRRLKLNRIVGPSKDILMMYVKSIRIDNISDDKNDTMLTSSGWNIIIIDVGVAAGRGSTTTKSIRIEGKQPVENSSETRKTMVEIPMKLLKQMCEPYPTLLGALERIRPRDPKGNRLYKQLQGLARRGVTLTEVFSKTILN